ncbi:hypothetical protein [Bradyrhizobium sp.]|uniref:hypothetical protein n=1 Tax=Bradyrhizobium sp. TaxID=376 RepID=UPI003C68689C
MTALARVLARAFPTRSALTTAILKQLALLGGAVLLVLILSMTYGVDLSLAFF